MKVSATISESTQSAKKYMVVVDDGTHKKTIHFGARGMSDYTKHKDENRRKAYLSRHAKNENWNDYWTAGFWAKNLLWEKPTLQASARRISTKYGINVRIDF